MQVVQLCPTLCDPMDCSLPVSYVLGDSPGKNTGMGSHFFLQGIFPTQGSNLGPLHGKKILYHHQGSPKVKALVSQLCLTLGDPMHGSPVGSSVHRILQISDII